MYNNLFQCIKYLLVIYMTTDYPYIRIGLCCQNITLRYQKPSIFAGKNLRLETLKKYGLDKAKEIAFTNLDNLEKLIKWNYDHGIMVFRMGSDLIPHGSNKSLIDMFGNAGKEYMTLHFVKERLSQIGKLVNSLGMRITMHPSQYVQLASPTNTVYENSVLDLRYHAKILNYMDLPPESVMVIHGGGVYCDKGKATQILTSRILNLPDKIRKRLVLENDEKCYNCDDLLPVCQKTLVPFVFDIFHYECYALLHKDVRQTPIKDLIPVILNTWKVRNIRPKVHLSEQCVPTPIKTDLGRVGAHSMFVNKIPDVLFTMGPIDIMLEAKGKEFAVGKIYKLYPKLQPPNTLLIPYKIPKLILKYLQKEITDLDPTDCDLCIKQTSGYYLKYLKYKRKYLKLKNHNNNHSLFMVSDR